ncbi:MAG: DUF3429 domain-containing protein [Steroidobacteraceae bacterium]|nr:DUF3429 domain-containing protein [Steroidobacteraceae bacterium]
MQQQDVNRGGLSPLAEWIGYAGLLPFLGAMLGVGLAPGIDQRDLAQRLGIGYGATILSFVGAVHWGLAVAGRWRWSAGVAFGSIAPSVVATLAVLLGGQRGLGLLVVGFGLFWVYEHRRLGASLPPDYVALRRTLSLAVCALLALTMILSERAGLR